MYTIRWLCTKLNSCCFKLITIITCIAKARLSDSTTHRPSSSLVLTPTHVLNLGHDLSLYGTGCTLQLQRLITTNLYHVQWKSLPQSYSQ